MYMDLCSYSCNNKRDVSNSGACRLSLRKKNFCKDVANLVQYS